MESKLKHLEFIQNVITRMNSNSFMIKGWAITIASAIMAIYATIQIDDLLLVGVIPIILFWLLDAYYLKQERLFRCLYNKAIQVDSKIPVFDMKIPEECKKNLKNSYYYAFFSKTIWFLYFSILIIVLVGFFSIKIFKHKPQKQNPLLIEMKDTINIKSINPIVFSVDTLQKK